MTDGADLQPNSLTDLKPIIKEFVQRLSQIEHEIETLTNDKKELFEEFSQKVDIKELKAALRVHKIQQKVSHRFAFDSILECLEDPTS
jgi:uncharacterized protein (UPF0335 family)